MKLNNYEMIIRPLGRTPADEYYHNGSYWIEGREGNDYQIELANHSAKRALFIVSVDGLDVLQGKPAGDSSQGYILPAGSNLIIPGWKLNNAEAAKFVFSRSRDSYTVQNGGNYTNTGVIGAMVFEEKDFSIPKYHYVAYNQSLSKGGPLFGNSMAVGNSQMADRRVSASQSTQDAADENLGTGFGDVTSWNTTTTTFEKKTTSPQDVLVIYYDTARNLEKIGINLIKRREVGYKANPFPQFSGAVPPPGWHRI